MVNQVEEKTLVRNFTVTSADVDFEGKIRVSSLVNFLIQSAWQHAELLGWGVNTFAKENLAWILSSVQIEISSYPNLKEEIKVETWPKGLNRLFYLRDFMMYDSMGKLFAKASSNWLIIDIDKRRPRMFQTENIDSLTLKDRHAIEGLIPTLVFNEGACLKTEYEVRYSNIDLNRHLTATGYFDFVFDTFHPQFISQHRPKTVTANFLKEVLYGEKVVMLQHEVTETSRKFQLEPAQGGKPLFRCEINF